MREHGETQLSVAKYKKVSVTDGGVQNNQSKVPSSFANVTDTIRSIADLFEAVKQTDSLAAGALVGIKIKSMRMDA